MLIPASTCVSSNMQVHWHRADIENLTVSSVQFDFAAAGRSEIYLLLKFSYVHFPVGCQLILLFHNKPRIIQFWITSHCWLPMTWYRIPYINLCKHLYWLVLVYKLDQHGICPHEIEMVQKLSKTRILTAPESPNPHWFWHREAVNMIAYYIQPKLPSCFICLMSCFLCWPL